MSATKQPDIEKVTTLPARLVRNGHTPVGAHEELLRALPSRPVGKSNRPSSIVYRLSSVQRQDLLNLFMIVGAWALMLLLVPAQHEFPIKDDWIYVGSV